MAVPTAIAVGKFLNAHLRDVVQLVNVPSMDAVELNTWQRQMTLQRNAFSAQLVEVARAVVASGSWQSHFADAAQCIAFAAGEQKTFGHQVIEIAEWIPEWPELEVELLDGQLSLTKVHLVLGGARMSAEDEPRLREIALNDSLHALTVEVNRIDALVNGPKSEKQARDQAFLTLKPSGSFSYRLSGSLSNEMVARLKPNLDKLTNGVFREQQHDGTFISLANCRAEALVRLGIADTRTNINIVVDGTALERGGLAPGERCEIVGVGAISLERLFTLLPEATVNAVAKDGKRAMKSRKR